MIRKVLFACAISLISHTYATDLADSQLEVLYKNRDDAFGACDWNAIQEAEQAINNHRENTSEK